MTLLGIVFATGACSGDDGGGGGTGTGSTSAASTSSTSTSSSSSTSTSTSTTNGSTTTGPTTATDTGTGDTGTGDTGTGDTGTGGGTTGGVSPCEQFCGDYFATCGNTNFNDYGTEADCVTACEGWTGDQFGCREMHLGLVQDPANDGHCGHASLDGGNVCP